MRAYENPCVIQSFPRGTELFKIRGKDMSHPLPYTEVRHSAHRADTFRETAGIIEQYLFLSHMKKYRRKSGKVAIERRCLRVASVPFAEIKLGGFLQSVTSQERISIGPCLDGVSGKGQIGPWRHHRCRRGPKN
jgi:hypothetical protein